MIQHKSPISGIAVFENKYVATAGYDNRVILWDYASRQALAVGFHDHLANSCSFSSDGTLLVSSSSDHTARIWSVPDMKLMAICRDHTDDVESVRFHPTRDLIATASLDHKARVFDLSGNLVREFSGHAADVIAVEWHPVRHTLLSCGDDGTIREWDLDAEHPIHTIALGDAETDSLAIAMDGTVYAGNDNGDIFVVRDNKLITVPAHSAGIKRIAVSPKCTYLASISYDRKLKVWAISATEPLIKRIHEVDLDASVWPRSCTFVDEETIAFGTFGSTFATLSLTNMTWNTSKVRPTPGINYSCEIDGDIYAIGDSGLMKMNGNIIGSVPSLCNFITAIGSMIVTGGQNGTVYNALTGEAIYQFVAPLNCAIVISKDDGNELIVGTYTGDVLIFKAASPTRLDFLRYERWHDNAIKGLAFSANYIFSVCASGKSQFRDKNAYKIENAYSNEEEEVVNGCVALSDFGFASVGRDKKLRIWFSGQDHKSEIISTQHSHSIKAVSANLSGDHIATGSYNGTISIYDVPTKSWIYSTRVTNSGISSLNLFKDGFIASSYDGHVYRVVKSGNTYDTEIEY